MNKGQKCSVSSAVQCRRYLQNTAPLWFRALHSAAIAGMEMNK